MKEMQVYAKYFIPVYKWEWICSILNKAGKASLVDLAIILDSEIYKAENINLCFENAIHNAELKKGDYIARWAYNPKYRAKALDIVKVSKICDKSVMGSCGEIVTKNQIICAFRRG